MAEVEVDPNHTTWLYVLYVESAKLNENAAQAHSAEVVCRWYVDEDNACSHAFVLSSAEESNIGYYSFLVVSHPSFEERTRELTLTISIPDGEHLCHAVVDLAAFSQDDNFKTEVLEMASAEVGAFAEVKLHTVVQERWMQGAPVEPQEKAYFADPQADAQANVLYTHFAGEAVAVEAPAEVAAEPDAGQAATGDASVEALVQPVDGETVAQRPDHQDLVPHATLHHEQERGAALWKQEVAEEKAKAIQEEHTRYEEEKRLREELERLREQDQTRQTAHQKLLKREEDERRFLDELDRRRRDEEHAGGLRQDGGMRCQWEVDRAFLRSKAVHENQRLQSHRSDRCSGGTAINSRWAAERAKFQESYAAQMAAQTHGKNAQKSRAATPRQSLIARSSALLIDGRAPVVGSKPTSSVESPRQSEPAYTPPSPRLSQELLEHLPPGADAASDLENSESCIFVDPDGEEENKPHIRAVRPSIRSQSAQRVKHQPLQPRQKFVARRSTSVQTTQGGLATRQSRGFSRQEAAKLPTRSHPLRSGDVLAGALGDVSTATLAGLGNVAAVEEAVLRLTSLQRELTKDTEDLNEGPLATAAAGLAPSMLQMLDAAKSVCEANRAKFRNLCEECHLSTDEMGCKTDYMRAQLQTLNELQDQYKGLLSPTWSEVPHAGYGSVSAPEIQRIDAARVPTERQPPVVVDGKLLKAKIDIRQHPTVLTPRAVVEQCPVNTPRWMSMNQAPNNETALHSPANTTPPPTPGIPLASPFTEWQNTVHAPLDPGAAGPQCPVLRPGASPRARPARPPGVRVAPTQAFDASTKPEWAHESHMRGVSPTTYGEEPSSGSSPHFSSGVGLGSVRGPLSPWPSGSCSARDAGGRHAPLRSAVQQLRNVTDGLVRTPRRSLNSGVVDGAKYADRADVLASARHWIAEQSPRNPTKPTKPLVEDKYLKILKSLHAKGNAGNGLAVHILEQSGLTPREAP